MNHGKITRPVIANMSQEFSQRHEGIRFIGAAKLPFTTPAKITTTMPQPICAFTRLSVRPTRALRAVPALSPAQALVAALTGESLGRGCELTESEACRVATSMRIARRPVNFT